MMPKWHAFWGFVFAVVLKLISPSISYQSLLIVFLASVFIDLDHYMTGCVGSRSLNPFKARRFHMEDGERRMKNWKKGKKEKEPFHLFHTVEFLALIAILGIWWNPLTYVFIGMVFHLMLDIGWMMYHDILPMREFFFFGWLGRKFEYWA